MPRRNGNARPRSPEPRDKTAEYRRSVKHRKKRNAKHRGPKGAPGRGHLL